MGNDLKQRFGSLVAANRKRRAMTQARLAELADLSVDMVARIEGGNSGARFPTIERLATALKVDPAELFTADIPDSALKRPKLSKMVVELAKMSDSDLDWLQKILPSLMTRR